MKKRWHLYTLFNAANDLIYVGFTNEPTERLYSHAVYKPWFSEVKNARWVEYPTERDVRDAEYSVIAAEHPKYNERGTDLCPRCRTNTRENARKGSYCTPCRRTYIRERYYAKTGGAPRKPPTITCPRCGGVKAAGPSYCMPCRLEVNRINYRRKRDEAPPP